MDYGLIQSGSPNRFLRSELFYKKKWNNKNFRVVGIIIVCYFIIAGVSEVFNLIPVLILDSIALIIAYIIINIKMMNYVEEKVQNKK